MAVGDYLKNRAAATSRYAISRITTELGIRPGVRRQELWERLDVDLTGASYYAVQGSDIGRLDLISYRFYRTPNYWWVIALVNNIKNQFTDVVVGATLVIPKADEVEKALMGRST